MITPLLLQLLLLGAVCITRNVSSLGRIPSPRKHFKSSSFLSNRRFKSTSLYYVVIKQRPEPQQVPSLPIRSMLSPLPHVPTLDTSGLLPPATYYDTTTIPDSAAAAVYSDMKHQPTCRIQIAWDVSLQPSQYRSSMGGEIAEITKEDVCNMVSNMQHAIDHGLTTLQLKPYTDSSKSKQLQYDVYQTLIEQTPKSILEQQSQIIVPVSIDDVLETKDFAIKSISSKSVRNHVLTLLDRLGTDCLDNIQIRFPNSVDHNTRSITSKMSTKNNHLTSKIGYDVMTAQFDNNQRRVDDRYYFDMIYELQELVREGYVRSISSKDLTSTMYQHIQSNHLHTLFNTNQLDLNLCRITPLIKAQPPVGQNSETDTTSITQHTIAANPLAGGWLVDRYFVESHHHLRQKRTPTSAWFRSLSQQEQWNWDQNIVQSWMSTRRTKQASSVGASNHDFGAVWDVYQMELLKPLRDIAMKHGVSVASVVLRWTLQQHEHVPTTNAAMSRHSAMCSSTVISCRLLPEHMYWDTHRPFTTVTERVQQLREVLRFTLDDDDIEKLWTLSSYIEPVVPDPIIVNNNYYDDNIEVSSSGLYIPKR